MTIKRRDCFTTLAVAVSSASLTGGVAVAAPAANNVELHTDLPVKIEDEKQLLADFYAKYLPRVKKAPGFVDAKLLKFRQANIGKAPQDHNYRLVQVFTSEELREKWTVHPDHKIAWHEALESHVKGPFTAFLYETSADAKRGKA